MTLDCASATGDRIAVVTGASSGIGAATAKVLADQGFQVVLVARRAELVKTIPDVVGGTAAVADITDGDAITKLADRRERVDVLVNNAGGAKDTRVDRRSGSRALALDLGGQRAGDATGDAGTAAEACAVGRRPDRDDHVDSGFRDRRRLHLCQARRRRVAPHAS